MFGLLFGKNKQDYTEQKESMRSAKVATRLRLARSPFTHKEVLYYLAEHDPNPKVRKAVARNVAMPVHVSPILAADPNVDVRFALAKRLTKLLPHASEDEHSQLYAFVVQSLGTLALDEVLKIRKALSSTLRDHAMTPPKVAAQLARDVERDVSEPILRYCAALADEELIDILKAHPKSWVVEAIANRGKVSAPVSSAVIETGDRPGGRALIKNPGAEIDEPLLHEIVERARSVPEWHEPIALRKSLPVAMVKELAGFVDASVRELLLNRDDFDEEESEEIAEIFRRRIDFETEKFSSGLPAKKRIKELMKTSGLGEPHVSDALAMRDMEFVHEALAALAQTRRGTVERIFEMGAAKPIVALCWRAGLSMRFALQLQKEMGQVQPKDLIYPKDGSDYPLSEDELNWQLEFLGLKKAS